MNTDVSAVPLDRRAETPNARLADHLAARRERLLETWQAAVAADPELTSPDDLSRNEFRDHIPQALDEFENHLRHADDLGLARHATDGLVGSTEHGEHRWKQGYNLREVILEWGHLHRCLLDELKGAQIALPDLTPEAFHAALRAFAGLVNTAIADSAEQFARLQHKAAIDERNDLERAVARFIEDGQRRAVVWRESTHDLRGQLSIITSATALLEEPGVEEALRLESLEMLQKGTRTLKEMLAGTLADTQVEATREERRLGSFDAAALLGGLCAASQPLARERGLSLRSKGPASFAVEGDRGKVQRIAQNLLLNALSYTAKGVVTVSWGEEDPAWWYFKVHDTGPGLPSKDNHFAGDGAAQPHGSGIGLSIVRHLSVLLDARLHIETASGAGTAFTVTLPRRYAA